LLFWQDRLAEASGCTGGANCCAGGTGGTPTGNSGCAGGTGGTPTGNSGCAGGTSDYIVTTDDGSQGRKGLVTEPLRELLEADQVNNPRCAAGATNKITGVIAIGPAVMMKFCAETVRPFGVKTIASLNTIMIDGTGMCGGCRVSVGGATKFTCVDGPEFDALAVDWDSVLSRQKIYCNEEKCSLEQYLRQTQSVG
ncbi:MAG: hypothetical protein FWD31_01165, partial [Planctomycetaceae bacterium]|nr:hypothetical protein [Planctomycetaceae bacterium]